MCLMVKLTLPAHALYVFALFDFGEERRGLSIFVNAIMLKIDVKFRQVEVGAIDAMEPIRHTAFRVRHFVLILHAV